MEAQYLFNLVFIIDDGRAGVAALLDHTAIFKQNLVSDIFVKNINTPKAKAKGNKHHMQ